jgi:hypothetical protein
MDVADDTVLIRFRRQRRVRQPAYKVEFKGGPFCKSGGDAQYTSFEVCSFSRFQKCPRGPDCRKPLGWFNALIIVF